MPDGYSVTSAHFNAEFMDDGGDMGVNTTTIIDIGVLQSGMARVLVSVRPGYEQAAMYFLRTGQIWCTLP